MEGYICVQFDNLAELNEAVSGKEVYTITGVYAFPVHSSLGYPTGKYCAFIKEETK